MTACRKLTFKTVESAERTVSIISGIRGGSGKPRRVYLCPRCDQYHLSGKEEAQVARPTTVLDLESTPSVPIAPAGITTPTKRAGAGEGSTSQPVQGAQETGLPASPGRKKREAHLTAVAGQAVKRAERAEARAVWFLEKMRSASTFIAEGESLLAEAVLRACVSLPKKIDPGKDRPTADQWLEQSVSDRLRWHLAGRPMKGRDP